MNFSPLDSDTYRLITVPDSSGQQPTLPRASSPTSSTHHTILMLSSRTNYTHLCFIIHKRVRCLLSYTSMVPINTSWRNGGESSGGISCKMETRGLGILCQAEWKGRWSGLPEVVRENGETFVPRKLLVSKHLIQTSSGFTVVLEQMAPSPDVYSNETPRNKLSESPPFLLKLWFNHVIHNYSTCQNPTVRSLP